VRFPIAELDFDAGVMRIERPDGVVFTEPLREYDRELNIRRLRIDYSARTLTLQLPDGSTPRIEMHLGDQAQEDFLQERTVVYLDQNHWSTIAAWRCDGRPITAAQAQAAEEICRLADAGEIVLPLSAGHMLETGALYGSRRQDVACAVLELSRGWLMRNPLWVRRDELATACAGRAARASNVFTLAADELFVRRLRVPNTRRMPPIAAELTKHLINVSALYDTLVDSAQIPDEGGRAAAESWGHSHAEVAHRLRAENASAALVRKVAHGRLLVDLVDEVRELWPDLERFDEWLRRSRTDVGSMPYLARMRAVLYARLRKGSPWTANDFTDVHYLSCAAGYADLVVGERRTIADLRRAREVTAGARLATHLSEAVAILREIRADTPSTSFGTHGRERPASASA
jgi:hypothetical protein